MLTQITPPDITLMYHDGSLLPLAGHAESIISSLPFRNSRLQPRYSGPSTARGITTVVYFTEHGTLWGTGEAYLSQRDHFSEEIGVTLATLRAVTGILIKHQPRNAFAISRRFDRYLNVALKTRLLNVDMRTLGAIENAWDALDEAAYKCPR